MKFIRKNVALDGPAAPEVVASEVVAEESKPTSDSADQSGSETQVPSPKKVHQIPALKSKLSAGLHAYRQHWKITAPLTIIVILGVIAAVPFTRYTALGFFIQRPLEIVVVDSATGVPVTDAQVALGGRLFATNNLGKTRVMTSLGDHTVSVDKRYYESAKKSVLVGLDSASNRLTVRLDATGRLVSFTITDKVSSKPVANATIIALDSIAKTDKTGSALLVLPLTVTTQTAKISADGYNLRPITLHLSKTKANTSAVALIPLGRMYFLSNLSGTIDVVSSNLDGSDRKTVLKGTGNEDQYSTALLASRDWKYLALYAQRKDGDNPEIDLITTDTDKVSNIDEGNATFSLVGWNDDRFIYRVFRNNVQPWQNGHEVLKSFDAITGKITQLAQTSAGGQQYQPYQDLDAAYILNNKVVYTLSWQAQGCNGYFGGKSATLNTIKSDGSNHSIVQSFSRAASASNGCSVDLTSRPYDEPESISLQFWDGKAKTSTYYVYDGDKLSSTSELKDSNFYDRNYPTFLLSPDGKQYLWSVNADGKSNLKIGDGTTKGSQTIATESDFSPYGWYSDNYLLLQKSDSELFLATADNIDHPLKITNYYKPSNGYPGYGSGYGGY